MKIAIGSDHAGFDYKTPIVEFLKELGHEVSDFGPSTADSVDYPDYAHPVASSVENQENELGILICGSANGVAITANKHQGIRAAIAWQNEIAALARQHNNANVLCIPARFIDLELAKKITNTFITTEFEGGRHATRVNKISCA
ncbi:MAG TPA: ribose 5-phosphate isomerase B [Sphingobacterium bovisgrunnientis]|jgi:ribose 5-phosphate isomerase B|uniref:ribose 5-phosphate isomerase B n=1 Tax=Sphingobacterium cavernae TaxID=2592657 RepID=UPI00122FEBDF|nr:ribose 5-phosphate isomerase B [Sphingobacterium cavernae]HLS38334.1 ribose 5-phosphate isomerase B [Sphingobacterium bovisgrunnientis]